MCGLALRNEKDWFCKGREGRWRKWRRRSKEKLRRKKKRGWKEASSCVLQRQRKGQQKERRNSSKSREALVKSLHFSVNPIQNVTLMRNPNQSILRMRSTNFIMRERRVRRPNECGSINHTEQKDNWAKEAQNMQTRDEREFLERKEHRSEQMREWWRGKQLFAGGRANGGQLFDPRTSDLLDLRNKDCKKQKRNKKQEGQSIKLTSLFFSSFLRSLEQRSSSNLAVISSWSHASGRRRVRKKRPRINSKQKRQCRKRPRTCRLDRREFLEGQKTDLEQMREPWTLTPTQSQSKSFQFLSAFSLQSLHFSWSLLAERDSVFSQFAFFCCSIFALRVLFFFLQK